MNEEQITERLKVLHTLYGIADRNLTKALAAQDFPARNHWQCRRRQFYTEIACLCGTPKEGTCFLG